MSSILYGKNIIKKFGGSEVLHGFDVNINEGDFTVVMGSSGSGKSTLLYLLSGMDKPSGGEIFFRDTEISRANEKELTQLRAASFGFVFQRTHLIGNLTVSENVRMAGLIGGLSEKECKSKTAELIRKMNLEKVENHLPSEVSGGEAQRTAVARAVINRPDVIFADEPTGALNRANSTEVLNLLSMLNENGQTVIVSLLFARQLVSIFIREPVTVGFGSEFLRVLCIAIPIYSLTFLIIAVFQAMGCGEQPFILSILHKGSLDILLLFLLRNLVGTENILWATLISETVALVTGIWMLVRFLKKSSSKLTSSI